MSSRNSHTSRVSIAEADPDLLKGIDADKVAEIRRAATADVMEIPQGRWSRESDPPRSLYGLFLVEGLVSRDVVIQGRRFAELLGPGDLLRPHASDDLDSSVPFGIGWEMLAPTRMAVLDTDFAQAVAPFPEFTAALMDRMMRRAHALAFHLAVSHLKLVEMRLLVILWYYSDRWGRVTPDGVLLPLRLTHGMLARIVGARRPSVSTALGRLQDRGLVDRTAGGHWLLLGSPPGELEDLPAMSGAPGR
jgi:hypothetical protein